MWGSLNLIVTGDWVSFTRRLEILLKHTDPDHWFNSWYFPLESGFFMEKYSFKYLGLYLMSTLVFLLMPVFNKRWRSLSFLLAYHAAFATLLWFLWQALGLQALLLPDFSYALQIPIFLAWPLIYSNDFDLKQRKLIFLVFILSGLLIIANTLVRHWTDTFFIEPGVILKSSMLTSFVSLSLVLCISFAEKIKNIKFFPLIILTFFYAFLSDQYKEANKEACVQNKGSYIFYQESIDFLLKIHNRPYKISVLNLPKEEMTITKGVCKGKTWRYGAVLHSMDWSMASLLYRVSPEVIWSAETYDEVIDDDFFESIKRHHAKLVVFEPDFDRLENIKNLALQQGFLFKETHSFNSNFLDIPIKARAYKLISRTL